MKHLVSIEAASKPFEGFWMKSACRIPNGKFPVIERFLSLERQAETRGSTDGHHCRSRRHKTSNLDGRYRSYSAASDFIG
jgi:hypothetical protein